MIIKRDKDLIQSYLEDASGLCGGNADCVAVPDNEAELADFLRQSSRTHTPVAVSGGGTGVTGGRISFGGAVVSLENFTSIGPVTVLSADRAFVGCGAGALIKDVKDRALSAGWMYPPDPTEQTSSIGGNIATNASGSRGFKYGPTRPYVKRVRVALANGDILDIERGNIPPGGDSDLVLKSETRTYTLRIPDFSQVKVAKNAAGYFLRPGMDPIDLFIGQEGTLGVITYAELYLVPAKKRITAGIAFFRSVEGAWDFTRTAKAVSRDPSSVIDALSLEYFDEGALQLLRNDYPSIPAGSRSAIYFEQELDGTDENAVMEGWAELLERHAVPQENVWFSSSPKEQRSFREFRHRLPERVNEIVRSYGFPKTGTDIAVPDDAFRAMLEFYYRQLESSGIHFLVFGHIGESHLHANLLPKNADEYRRSKEIYQELARKAVSLGGTVSAEHGIGKLKHHFLRIMMGDEALRSMVEIKKSLDPSRILSPDNVFPRAFLSADHR